MSDNEDFQSQNANRRTYLVTYSQADLDKFATRREFGEAVEAAFNAGSGKVEVSYWACCMETHENTGGQHYHCSVKLSGPKRWNRVRQNLATRYGINVNFSESAENYYNAYRYVTKTDTNVYESPNHPDLRQIGSPKTKYCMKAYQQKHKNARQLKHKQQNEPEQTTVKPPKVRRLSNLDVSEFLVKHNITTDTELYAKAHEQQEDGKKDLAQFVLSRNAKSLQNIIATTWKMRSAAEQLARKEKPPMDMIRDCAEGDCVEGCNGVWLDCAIEVLQNNRTHPIIFAHAIRDLLEKGRGKFRNVMIIGPANCAKTFLLNPITKIFKTFTNPANNKYAWLGAESSEVIFLNDFRWSSEMIAWKELLLLLEGQTVHLPSPKNHYSSDICIDADTPVFAIGKSRVTYAGRYNTTDEVENEMMALVGRSLSFLLR